MKRKTEISGQVKTSHFSLYVVNLVNTGHKKYELKNHLGNVMAVVHGRKQAVQGSSGLISHYSAIPAFSGDYSAFGVRLRGRGNGDYRYGFQDQEHDTETFRGGSVNYKYRMHRPDLGRFFSVDPLHKDYPWNSGYAFSENIVIDHIELEGLEKIKPLLISNTRPKQEVVNAELTKIAVKGAMEIALTALGGKYEMVGIASDLQGGIEMSILPDGFDDLDLEVADFGFFMADQTGD